MIFNLFKLFICCSQLLPGGKTFELRHCTVLRFLFYPNLRDSNGSCIPEEYGLIALLTVLRIMQTPRSKDMTKDDHCKVGYAF